MRRAARPVRRTPGPAAGTGSRRRVAGRADPAAGRICRRRAMALGVEGIVAIPGGSGFRTDEIAAVPAPDAAFPGGLRLPDRGGGRRFAGGTAMVRHEAARRPERESGRGRIRRAADAGPIRLAGRHAGAGEGHPDGRTVPVRPLRRFRPEPGGLLPSRPPAGRTGGHPVSGACRRHPIPGRSGSWTP